MSDVSVREQGSRYELYNEKKKSHTEIEECIARVRTTQASLQLEAVKRTESMNILTSRLSDGETQSIEDAIVQLPFYTSKVKSLAQKMITLTQTLREMSLRAAALKLSDEALREETESMRAIIAQRPRTTKPDTSRDV
eukprot:CFRG7803T1